MWAATTAHSITRINSSIFIIHCLLVATRIRVRAQRKASEGFLRRCSAPDWTKGKPFVGSSTAFQALEIKRAGKRQKGRAKSGQGIPAMLIGYARVSTDEQNLAL